MLFRSVYGEHENGGTNTLYVSPVPFETLDAAIDKGPGRPHLQPAEDRMADANNIGTALLVAPLAGAALAVGRALKLARRADASPPDVEPPPGGVRQPASHFEQNQTTSAPSGSSGAEGNSGSTWLFALPALIVVLAAGFILVRKRLSSSA